jgi:Cu(I)/Ag(I) efflux system periplasmic protein CusF
MQRRPLLALLAGFAPALGALAQTATAEGEVVKIDAAGARITLKHGEIKSLDMPPMTMVYRVKDPAALARLQVGDKVRFRAEKVGGQYVATSVEPLK